MSTRAAPRSSAVAALSQAEAPPPSMATDLPRSAAKSMSSLVWAARSGTSPRSTKSGQKTPPAPARPVARTTRRANHVSMRPVFIQHGPHERSLQVRALPRAAPCLTGKASTFCSQDRYSTQVRL